MSLLLERETRGRVDREKGIIHNVRILGADSANGRLYESRALDQAVMLYEGRPVRVGHKPDARRDITDDVGFLRNVRREGDTIRGDIHFMLAHPMAEAILERAEKFPETFGLSHHADGIVKPGRDGIDRVTEIVEVTSVDLVEDPATNHSLFESGADGVFVMSHKQRLDDKLSRLEDYAEGVPRSQLSPMFKAFEKRMRELRAAMVEETLPDMPVRVELAKLATTKEEAESQMTAQMQRILDKIYDILNDETNRGRLSDFDKLEAIKELFASLADNGDALHLPESARTLTESCHHELRIRPLVESRARRNLLEEKKRLEMRFRYPTGQLVESIKGNVPGVSDVLARLLKVEKELELDPTQVELESRRRRKSAYEYRRKVELMEARHQTAFPSSHDEFLRSLR